jgi:acetyl-CoA carboxylase biotin carboxyl carrier protein
MDLRKVALIELVESSGIGELEVGRRGTDQDHRASSAAAQTVMVNAAPMSVPSSAAPVLSAPLVPAEAEGHIVKSPMVGTFYRAAFQARKRLSRSVTACKSATRCASSKR